MRFGWLPGACCLLGLVAVSSGARADVFNFDGTLSQSVGGGTSVTGQFSFDFGTQQLTNTSFTVPGDAVSLASISSVTGTGSTPGSFFKIDVLNGNGSSGDGSELDLYFNSTFTQFYTLIDTTSNPGGIASEYTCLNTTNCPSSGSGFPGEFSSFASGTVSGVATVPEPASLALLGAALAGLGVIRRRKRAA